MSPVRRAPMDQVVPPFDPDPRHVDEDAPRRRPPEPDRSGMVIVYIVAGVLIVLIAIAVLHLAGWHR